MFGFGSMLAWLWKMWLSSAASRWGGTGLPSLSLSRRARLAMMRRKGEMNNLPCFDALIIITPQTRYRSMLMQQC
ncbi:uncharacterized protein B0I36DRAFT_342447 [Microdochium trichocladiopsis]|uniref:Secreted protein n=1 Tax=Microdochium trichocladiopsis TaxID=1682393 RepID=A0A9P9BKI6_9PEZI|nr:uncharacterized protein B0I36DRAFT_342447 [Microdochium trichocladiopsis]KAH7009451.1 hypothetical protein B0I36DRAFT_342447 [Microdochium trichocladiopsis]